MDEQNSKKETPKKNRATRPLSDPANGIDYAEKKDRSGQSNSGQTDHYIWELPWPQFVAAAIAFLAVSVGIVTAGLRWHADMISQDLTKQKDRARIVLSAMRRISTTPLSFSLIFKNVGETAALGTEGAWLRGECQYTSSQECVNWCLRTLPEAEGKNYGPLIPQAEHTEEFFYTLKTGKARKKHRTLYYCGYFAYTDVFCIWRRQFHALSFDPATDRFSFHPLNNQEEEAQVENCSP